MPHPTARPCFKPQRQRRRIVRRRCPAISPHRMIARGAPGRSPLLSPRSSRRPATSNTTSSPDRSGTLDSTPTAQGPLSSTAAILPDSSCRVPRRGRTDFARTVGRWCGDRPPALSPSCSDLMGWNADRQCVQPRAGQQTHRAALGAWQHQRQWPRPERRRKPPRTLIRRHIGKRNLSIRVMADQRIEPRPLLRGKDRCNRAVVRRIRAEPVNRFGAECHQLTAPQQCRSTRNAAGISFQHFCHGHADNH